MTEKTQLIVSAEVQALVVRPDIRAYLPGAINRALAEIVDEMRGLGCRAYAEGGPEEPWQTMAITRQATCALVSVLLTQEWPVLALHRNLMAVATTDDGSIEIKANSEAIANEAVVASLAARLRQEPELPLSEAGFEQMLAEPFGMVTAEQIAQAIGLVTATQAADFEQYKAEHPQPDA